MFYIFSNCPLVSVFGFQSLSPTSIDVYLASVRALHLDLGFPDPITNAHQLRRVLKGIHRVRSGSRPSRRPITRNALRAIYDILRSVGLDRDAMMFWAACCLAFFGFLRASEFTSSSPFNVHNHLSPVDVEFHLASSPSALRITKRYKAHPFGNGFQIYGGRTYKDICPVITLQNYLAIGGAVPVPLFVWSDGSLLTVPQVNFYLRDLTRAGFFGYYSTHSFRIGAATEGAEAGVPEHLIQTLGRWSSHAYLRHIHTSPDTIARIALVL